MPQQSEIINSQTIDINQDVPLCCRTSFTIGEVITQPESSIYEFKNYSLPIPKERNLIIRKTICGFLNNLGGIIFVGIDQNNDTKKHTVTGCYLNQYMKEEFLKLMRINLCSIQPDIVVNSKASIKFVPVKKNSFPFQCIGGRYVIKIKIEQGLRDELYTYRTDEGEYFIGVRTQNQVLTINFKSEPRKILAIQKERARMVYLEQYSTKTPEDSVLMLEGKYQCDEGSQRNNFHKNRSHQFCRQPESGYRIFEVGGKAYTKKKIGQEKVQTNYKVVIKQQSLNDIETQKIKGIMEKKQQKQTNEEKSEKVEERIIKKSKPKKNSTESSTTKRSPSKEQPNNQHQNKQQSKKKSQKQTSKQQFREQMNLEQSNNFQHSIFGTSAESNKSHNNRRGQFLNYMKGINNSMHHIYIFKGFGFQQLHNVISKCNSDKLVHVSCVFEPELVLYKFDELTNQNQLKGIFEAVKDMDDRKKVNETVILIQKLNKTLIVPNFIKFDLSRQEKAKKIIIEIQNTGKGNKKKEKNLSLIDNHFMPISSLNLHLTTSMVLNTSRDSDQHGSLAVTMPNLARSFLAFLYLKKENIKCQFA